jgi:undecaprenyl diphosphate synthase
LLTNNTPNVDLLIRTGNEKRISNFLLWQSAYAEIIFEPTLWPDYNKNIFKNNILEYCSRQRRFGKI